MIMIFKIFFSYFSFVTFFAYSASLFQNNLLQQVVSSAAPQLKEEATKSLGNLTGVITPPSNQPIVSNAPVVTPPPSNTPQTINNTTSAPPVPIIAKPKTDIRPLIVKDKKKPSEQKKINPPKKEKNSFYKKYVGFALTLEEGEEYFKNILKATKKFSSKDTLSSFKAASATSFDTKTLDAAVVCFQKVKQGYYRTHSLNPHINGIVTDEHDKSLIRRIFQLDKADKFNFFIRTGADNAGDIMVFNGLVFSKSGKGYERGDSVCFARYNVEKIKAKN